MDAITEPLGLELDNAYKTTKSSFLSSPKTSWTAKITPDKPEMIEWMCVEIPGLGDPSRRGSNYYESFNEFPVEITIPTNGLKNPCTPPKTFCATITIHFK